MIRSILVVIDDTKATQVAKSLAIELAGRFRADLLAISVLDLNWILGPEESPIWGAAFIKHSDQLEQFRDHYDSRLLQFEEECRERHVEVDVRILEGGPGTMIERSDDDCDILIIGKDANFHLKDGYSVTGLVGQLYRELQRPLIVTPQRALAGNDVLIAYDGSPGAVRSLHMALHLGLLADRQVHVISVNSDEKIAERCVERAARFLGHHGHTPELMAIASKSSASDVLISEIEAKCPELVVAGAHAGRVISDLFLGSTITRILELSPAPVFLYH